MYNETQSKETKDLGIKNSLGGCGAVAWFEIIKNFRTQWMNVIDAGMPITIDERGWSASVMRIAKTEWSCVTE